MSDGRVRLRFDEFELDEANALLTRAGTPVSLTPKAFAVLCALAREPGRLADKNGLLDAVWGHRFVSESVLKSTISQVRAALVDDAAQPRYIETVSRRGYRFIGRVAAATAEEPSAAAAAAQAQPVPGRTGPRDIIGREPALERLHASWQRAQRGERQLVWIAGEAGIGKTTLVDQFLVETAAARNAHGQCVEQFGAGEPYRPILEALRELCRGDAELPLLLRSMAPTWLVQMPWLVAEADRGALLLAVAGAGQERMVREIVELLENYSQAAPLLLVTEDLHWADSATLRLMEHFARRRAPLRVLWVATFRLAQVIAEQHPLKTLRQELQLHRLCDEILLDPFSETEVAAYVARRWPNAAVSEAFVERLHAHTDGLPLFVASILPGLMGADRDAAGRVEPASARELPVPDNLAGAIEKQLERLAPDARAMLEAASVCGVEFRAQAVADLLALDSGAVATALDELVRRRYWLRDVGIAALPDGRVDTRYAFHHALYKHVLYQRLSAARRVGYHRLAARSSEPLLGLAVTHAELASHYELGRELGPALKHYVRAAEAALARFAPSDTLELTSRALSLLERVPEGPPKMELELGLLAHRGFACAQLFGVSSPESMRAFERVRQLCDALPPSPERALLLNGLGWSYYTRGAFADALAIANGVHELAERHGSDMLKVYATAVIGVTLATQGRLETACDWFARGIAICERLGPTAPWSPYVLDPEVSLRAVSALPLTQRGFADQGRRQVQLALERANRIGQPIAKMLALWCAAQLNVRLRRPAEVASYAAELAALTVAASLRQALGPSLWLRGWAEACDGEPQTGYDHILEGYSHHEQLGMYGGCTEVLGYAAEAALLDGRVDDAASKVDEGLALAERLGENGMLVDLLLVQARVHAALGKRGAARAARERAVAVAREQGALGGEVDALAAIAEGDDRTAADLAQLRDAFGRLRQGLDTPLAERVRTLLAGAEAATRANGRPDRKP
jgi:DNA-binding winged helix-turn-helix (wHTH) protein/tetratricopeptide (TPR) repeat protein